ncbi:hypothetical protein DFH06DRAFT_650866 [Mycena polygramma]|nr:hypothetical protein DFH06DRAFT_650866 [Mycena polygramma]
MYNFCGFLLLRSWASLSAGIPAFFCKHTEMMAAKNVDHDRTLLHNVCTKGPLAAAIQYPAQSFRGVDFNGTSNVEFSGVWSSSRMCSTWCASLVPLGRWVVAHTHEALCFAVLQISSVTIMIILFTTRPPQHGPTVRLSQRVHCVNSLLENSASKRFIEQTICHLKLCSKCL